MFGSGEESSELDIYAYKQERLLKCLNGSPANYGRVGLLMQLGMYEQLPIWGGFFESLGFRVVLSEKSSLNFCNKQHNLISNRLCYPAKLIRKHIESLIGKGVDFIFMPCESYYIDGRFSASRDNCSVAAYYPELLKADDERLTDSNFLMPYIDLNMQTSTVRKLHTVFKKYGFSKRRIRCAIDEGLARYNSYRTDIMRMSEWILQKSEEENRHVVVLCGRPYHLDGEVNHGINKQLASLRFAVLSEDSVFENSRQSKNIIFNQRTYQSRLHGAANFVSSRKNAYLVQLVSLGCPIDALIADEVRSIMQRNGKPYTQIIIDEK